MKAPANDPIVYKITLSKTADGTRQYLQIISADGFQTNVVLIADLFELKDTRHA